VEIFAHAKSVGSTAQTLKGEILNHFSDSLSPFQHLNDEGSLFRVTLKNVLLLDEMCCILKLWTVTYKLIREEMSMAVERTKKTKIICTVGPASESEEMMKKMILAGMNVMRCNFSHGTHEEHGIKMARLRKVNNELGTNVAIMLDTKGPEIRTGDFEGGQTEFVEGQRCIITPEEIVGTSDRFTITYKSLYTDVKPGSRILVNDGQVSLLVDRIDGSDIYTTSENNGIVKDKRGINVPGVTLNFKYLSEKDRSDIEFGCEQDINFIAASFARRAQDILDIKRLCAECDRADVQIIAKIENFEGVKNIDEILDVADGIMVARGDLGVEVPAEEVPFIQRHLIRECNHRGKVVIIATQMLESMINNPRPTRAEVSDVANAIYDGTDAIMLSGETAAGKYPEEAVKMMNTIALKTEYELDYGHLHRRAILHGKHDSTSDAICLSVAEIAMKYNVSAIIAFTESGSTARLMSRYRPECPLIVATPKGITVRKLALNWGVNPVLVREMKSKQGLLNLANIVAQEFGISIGETIIVLGGTPGVVGQTNYLELWTIK